MANLPNIPSSRMKMPKKLIVLCDGTWQNSDAGGENGKLQVPSNVTRIARALKPEGHDNHPQILYYQAGLGSSSWSAADHILGGGLAYGVSENIREAYSFLVNNYTMDPTGNKDEIYLIGFSRGAFTARSVGGMTSTLGLLTKKAMAHFYYIFEDFESAGKSDYEPKIKSVYKDFTVKHKSSEIKEYLADYKMELIRLNLTRDVGIQAIAVWDTVGTLGLPIHPILQKLGASSAVRQYRFFDTGISNRVKNAFHALALDERRAAFDATVWEKQDDNRTTNLKQCWFSGAHSNIGGSYDDSSQADLTLAWMVDQLSPFLSFDEEYVVNQFKQTLADHYVRSKDELTAQAKAEKRQLWQWGRGTINDSLKFPTSLAGSTTRAPGRYYQLDYLTGKPDSSNPQLLVNTNEHIHASVRARKDLGGLNASLKLPYATPPSLANWTMTSNDKDGKAVISWTYKNAKDNKDPANGVVLHEMPLGKLESRLLEEDAATKAALFGSIGSDSSMAGSSSSSGRL